MGESRELWVGRQAEGFLDVGVEKVLLWMRFGGTCSIKNCGGFRLGIE